MDTLPNIPAMPSLSAIDDELQLRRGKELAEKIEEAREIVNKYREEHADAGAELAFRLREEEVSSRDRISVKHQANEAAFIDRLAKKEGILQKVPNHPFTWTVEWNQAPQEFTVNVTSLRGLRNKVRDGYYVFLISVYDRVGGQCYRFANGETSLDCNAALPPLRYVAKSSNIDFFINQKVSLSCPSPLLLTTHAVLCVELWQLRVGKYDPVDKVVGFGYFPLVDHNMRVVEGRFKMPIIVGKAEENIDTFRQMGSLIEGGLQYWLGNLYVEVKLTRRHEKVQEAERAAGNNSTFTFDDLDDVSAHSLRQDKTADDVRSLTFPQLPPRLFFDDVRVEADKLGIPQSIEEKKNFQVNEVSADASSSDLKNMNSAIWSKRAQLEEEKRALQRESQRRIRQALTQNTAQDVEIHDLRIRSELQKDKATKQIITKEPLHELEEATKNRDSHVLLENHHHALVSQREFFFMGRNFTDKQKITASVVLDDIGYNAAGSWDKMRLATTIIFAILGLYTRILVHGVGKYLYLGAIDIPITEENWYAWHIDLRFEFTTARFYPFNSALAALVPNLIVIAVFLLFGITFFALIRIFDRLPYPATRLVFWLGIGALLDAPLTLLFESAHGNFESGEPFLLYRQFMQEERSGIHGALLITIMYITIALPQAYFMYLYATYVHLNGRAVDIYQRITYPEMSFFVPTDIEISSNEMKEIVKRAKNFRSESGDIKRVTVRDFNYKFTCLFRNRLFSLLSVLSNEPEEWITRYCNMIAVRRPRHAVSRIVDNLGSFKLGEDIMLFMRRHFPTMCANSEVRLGDRNEDHYYEQDTIFGIANHSTAEEDEKELRAFLRQYFLAQVYDVKPVEWDPENPLSFTVRDASLLADLIFFETDSHLLRVLKLRSYLKEYCSDILDAEQEKPESYQRVSLPNFDRHEPLTSTQGEDAQGVIVFVSAENPATGTVQLLRSLVVTPFGQILEPKPNAFTFKSKHTADDPEFWAAKSIDEARHTAKRAEYGLKLH